MKILPATGGKTGRKIDGRKMKISSSLAFETTRRVAFDGGGGLSPAAATSQTGCKILRQASGRLGKVR
jgi:hypothetical protein